METVSVQIPDVILESHHHNLETVKEDLQQGFVIWEYINGYLSLKECGDLLKVGYRGFIELLWSKGIPIDGLSEPELQEQVSNLRSLLRK
jgi:predicted HTH domain antitoxin